MTHAATKSCTNFWLCIVAGVDLGDGSELGVRAEDEVDGGGSPLDICRYRGRGPRRRARRWRRATRCPCRAGSRRSRWSASPAVPVRTPCSLVPGVRVEDAQAADEHRHLRRGQRPAGSTGRSAAPRAGACRRAGSSCGTRRRSVRGRRKLSTSVCSCDASVRPGENGTCTSCPASLAACSMAAHPPRTIRSASETFFPSVCAPLKSAWIASRVCEHLSPVRPGR